MASVQFPGGECPGASSDRPTSNPIRPTAARDHQSRLLSIPVCCVVLLFLLLAAPQAKADLIEGLLTYWTCNEGSGTVAHDLTASHNDATLSASGATWASGHSGTGLSFDGTGYADVASFAGLPLGASPRTIAAWVKPSASNANQFMLGYGHHADKQLFGFFRKEDWNSFGFSIEGHNYNLATHVTLPADTWTYIAATLASNGTLTAYVNGSPVQDGAYGAFDTASSSFRLGDSPAGGIPFHGVIDEVAVYDRALSGTEISALMTTALPEPGSVCLVAFGLSALWARRAARRRNAAITVAPVSSRDS